MDVNVHFFLSDNENEEIHKEHNEVFLNELSLKTGMRFHIDNHVDNASEVILIGGGGTEGKLKALINKFQEPVILLTTGENNSLAASLEILSYFKKMGKKGLILHGDVDDVAKRLNNLVKVKMVLHNLKGMRLGKLGEASDWLIASDVDEEKINDTLGMEVVHVSMQEVFEEISKNQYEDDEFTLDLKNHDFDRDELENALYVYGAFKRIKDEYNLKAITVRCFDLLKPFKTTGCLGLAILNACGIYGGCEGDMQTLVSMVLLGELSDKPVFMCNPSRISTTDKNITLAHCTLPLNMPCSYKLNTHFESNLGVAIAGEIPLGKCTMFKCAGDLSRYYVQKGEIIKNLNENNLCRTQIMVHLDDGVDYFLNDPIGNHHLIVCGDFTEVVEEFFNLI